VLDRFEQPSKDGRAIYPIRESSAKSPRNLDAISEKFRFVASGDSPTNRGESSSEIVGIAVRDSRCTISIRSGMLADNERTFNLSRDDRDDG